MLPDRVSKVNWYTFSRGSDIAISFIPWSEASVAHLVKYWSAGLAVQF